MVHATTQPHPHKWWFMGAGRWGRPLPCGMPTILMIEGCIASVPWGRGDCGVPDLHRLDLHRLQRVCQRQSCGLEIGVA